MAASELNLFSIEILGLVGRDGAGPHDLLRMTKQGRMLAWAGESQYYTEPKRLARLGYLSSRKEPGKTGERTVYALTDKGLEALRDYARTPVTFTPLKSDALLRLLICDLQQRLDDAQRSAHQLPHREKYLLLVNGFLRRLLELQLELIDEVDRELAPTAPKRARQPA